MKLFNVERITEINNLYKNHLDIVLSDFFAEKMQKIVKILRKIFRFCEQKIRIEGRSEAQTSASFFIKKFCIAVSVF